MSVILENVRSSLWKMSVAISGECPQQSLDIVCSNLWRMSDICTNVLQRKDGATIEMQYDLNSLNRNTKNTIILMDQFLPHQRMYLFLGILLLCYGTQGIMMKTMRKTMINAIVNITMKTMMKPPALLRN